jgi:two-component system osmolarity sensor histidine kinase EnvZ
VSNLVDNAVRYGAGQPIDIEYRVADGLVEICILDRGPGIPEHELEAVFRPFYRIEPSRSTRTGGSGLGLAIVRQLATANQLVGGARGAARRRHRRLRAHTARRV